ncbi:uncharacterized protein [Narcine bancroftii]|uniref:uncharacterized protein n=1 Tax=Narcine bancroftii TaxID=1343680 RepID=UPI003831998B
MDYYLGWMKLEVNASEKGTDHNDSDCLDWSWKRWSWSTAIFNVSEANVHALCQNSTFGISQYPIFHFIFGLNRNYSLEWFYQTFWNLPGTSDFVRDIAVGEEILYPCSEQSESASRHYERHRTWSSNGDPEVIQRTDSLKNVISELALTPSEKSRENHSATFTWADENTLDPANDTLSVSQLEGRGITTHPSVSLGRWEMTIDTEASSSMDATFTAFRSSVSITNCSFYKDLNNKTNINYRKLEKTLTAQLPPLLTEAAVVVLNQTLEFTVVVEEFKKHSLIVDLVFLTHLENVTLASMNSVFVSAVNQRQRFPNCLLMLSKNIEDFIPCEKNICIYDCHATDRMYNCTCINALNGDRFTCMPTDTSLCDGTQFVIPGPLTLDLENIAQLLDFTNNTACTYSRSKADKVGILHVKDLCLNKTDIVTDLWLEWKNKEILHLVLEGPNIAVCQFSVSSKEQMMFILIDNTDGFKRSFLVDYSQQSPAFENFEYLQGTLKEHRKSLAVYKNENLYVTVSIQTRLASNPKLFVKNCEVMPVSHKTERVKFIENGCPVFDGLSSFLNGNSSFVLLSVNASIIKNFSLVRCEVQICAATHCGCTRNKMKKSFVPNSNSLQENEFEIGPIIVMERISEDQTKKDEPNLMTVILLTVGVILLAILIIGALRSTYRRISDVTYAARVLKKTILRRQSSMDPVTLMNWKQL